MGQNNGLRTYGRHRLRRISMAPSSRASQLPTDLWNNRQVFNSSPESLEDSFDRLCKTSPPRFEQTTRSGTSYGQKSVITPPKPRVPWNNRKVFDSSGESLEDSFDQLRLNIDRPAQKTTRQKETKSVATSNTKENCSPITLSSSESSDDAFDRFLQESKKQKNHRRIKSLAINKKSEKKRYNLRTANKTARTKYESSSDGDFSSFGNTQQTNRRNKRRQIRRNLRNNVKPVQNLNTIERRRPPEVDFSAIDEWSMICSPDVYKIPSPPAVHLPVRTLQSQTEESIENQTKSMDGSGSLFDSFLPAQVSSISSAQSGALRPQFSGNLGAQTSTPNFAAGAIHPAVVSRFHRKTPALKPCSFETSPITKAKEPSQSSYLLRSSTQAPAVPLNGVARRDQFSQHSSLTAASNVASVADSDVDPGDQALRTLGEMKSSLMRLVSASQPVESHRRSRSSNPQSVENTPKRAKKPAVSHSSSFFENDRQFQVMKSPLLYSTSYRSRYSSSITDENSTRESISDIIEEQSVSHNDASPNRGSTSTTSSKSQHHSEFLAQEKNSFNPDDDLPLSVVKEIIYLQLQEHFKDKDGSPMILSHSPEKLPGTCAGHKEVSLGDVELHSRILDQNVPLSMVNEQLQMEREKESESRHTTAVASPISAAVACDSIRNDEKHKVNVNVSHETRSSFADEDSNRPTTTIKNQISLDYLNASDSSDHQVEKSLPSATSVKPLNDMISLDRRLSCTPSGFDASSKHQVATETVPNNLQQSISFVADLTPDLTATGNRTVGGDAASLTPYSPSVGFSENEPLSVLKKRLILASLKNSNNIKRTTNLINPALPFSSHGDSTALDDSRRNSDKVPNLDATPCWNPLQTRLQLEMQDLRDTTHRRSSQTAFERLMSSVCANAVNEVNCESVSKVSSFASSDDNEPLNILQARLNFTKHDISHGAHQNKVEEPARETTLISPCSESTLHVGSDVPTTKESLPNENTESLTQSCEKLTSFSAVSEVTPANAFSSRKAFLGSTDKNISPNLLKERIQLSWQAVGENSLHNLSLHGSRPPSLSTSNIARKLILRSASIEKEACLPLVHSSTHTSATDRLSHALQVKSTLSSPQECSSRRTSKFHRNKEIHRHARKSLLVTLSPGFPKAAPLSSREIVLQHCNQLVPQPFSDFVKNFKKIAKIGEGAYGEVYSSQNDINDSVAIKVVPIEGKILVNNDKQKTFGEVLPEIAISLTLSNLDEASGSNCASNFVHLHSVKCVTGEYPNKLLTAWKKYDSQHTSENDNPDIFDGDQLYMAFVFNNAGVDLERYQYGGAAQAYSTLVQVACTLAVAENAVEFEHRDLHWGNILLNQTNDNDIDFRLQGTDFQVPSHGVHITLIDFTLSRLKEGHCVVSSNLSDDPYIFKGEGDYQFEVYRLMYDRVNDQWDKFCPYTNILWLHYLLLKLCKEKQYKSRRRADRSYIVQMETFSNEILSYSSATEFVERNLNLFKQ